jgi:PRTRC genetic system protein C
MLVTTSLERVFYFDDNGQDIKLSDPDNGLSPEAVLNFYSNTYPILTTAKIDGPDIRDDEVQYRFATTIGTKG